MNLSNLKNDLIDQLSDNVAVIVGGEPIKKLGSLFEETAISFQALGICNLLLSMDSDGLHRNLILSGFTRRYFLKRSQLEKNSSDEHLAISRNESFFDAVAAGAIELAREIVNLSPNDWISDGEYEDDFCYYFFFHNFVKEFKNPDKAILKNILTRFEKSLEGDSARRLNICKALYEFDEKMFQNEFQEFINERESQIESDKDIFGHELTFEPRSHIFVEALFLLKIAEMMNYKTQKEYQYCPSIARIPMKEPFPHDIYVDIEKEIHK